MYPELTLSLTSVRTATEMLAGRMHARGIDLLGVRLAFDAGTLLFPVSYIFGDILTEVYGYRRSRRVIWTGFACAALVSRGGVRAASDGIGIPGADGERPQRAADADLRAVRWSELDDQSHPAGAGEVFVINLLRR